MPDGSLEGRAAVAAAAAAVVGTPKKKNGEQKPGDNTHVCLLLLLPHWYPWAPNKKKNSVLSPWAGIMPDGSLEGRAALKASTSSTYYCPRSALVGLCSRGKDKLREPVAAARCDVRGPCVALPGARERARMPTTVPRRRVLRGPDSVREAVC
jgi:hypothetical protein